MLPSAAPKKKPVLLSEPKIMPVILSERSEPKDPVTPPAHPNNTPKRVTGFFAPKGPSE